ncbi:MAG: DUF1045 domain-containing protein [Pseudomonadota bacterium]
MTSISMRFKRFAIYYTPPEGAFSAAAAHWLGWDCARGQAVKPASAFLDALAPLDWNETTQAPRRYGFHATIKPPFALAPGQQAAELSEVFALHCRSQKPVALDGLTLSPMGRFLALVPEKSTQDLSELAAKTVRDLDMFRAAPSIEELARRRSTGLTPQQELLLQTWGYPYVMEAFRFHMTLTGRLPKADLPRVANVLNQLIVPHLPRPFPLDALSLMGEDEAGHFHVITRLALSG